MKITIITNNNRLYMTLENKIIRNKQIYKGKLFDTIDDFIEHLYQTAIILTNKTVTLDRDIFDGSICIATGPVGRYSKTFIF